MARPPRSVTSDSVSPRSPSAAVTPKTHPDRRGRSTSVPLKVIAGCIATVRAPTSRAGSRTARPWRPLVCTTTWPSRIAPLALSIVTTLESMSSGTVSRSRSHARDIGRLRDLDAGQERVDAPAGGVGLTSSGDDLVPGSTERGGQHGADAAGTDHTDTELRHVDLFVSVPRGYRSTAINIEPTPADSVAERMAEVTHATPAYVRRAGAAWRGPGRRPRTAVERGAATCG